MSAIFNFQSLLTVVLLLICTCAYIRSIAPNLLDRNKEGLLGIFWKCARIAKYAKSGGFVPHDYSFQACLLLIVKVVPNDIFKFCGERVEWTKFSNSGKVNVVI